jgi:hypothetical protein
MREGLEGCLAKNCLQRGSVRFAKVPDSEGTVNA